MVWTPRVQHPEQSLGCMWLPAQIEFSRKPSDNESFETVNLQPSCSICHYYHLKQVEKAFTVWAVSPYKTVLHAFDMHHSWLRVQRDRGMSKRRYKSEEPASRSRSVRWVKQWRNCCLTARQDCVALVHNCTSLKLWNLDQTWIPA